MRIPHLILSSFIILVLLGCGSDSSEDKEIDILTSEYYQNAVIRQAGQEYNSSILQGLAKSNNQFGFDLLKVMQENSNENILISPYSISHALAVAKLLYYNRDDFDNQSKQIEVASTAYFDQYNDFDSLFNNLDQYLQYSRIAEGFSDNYGVIVEDISEKSFFTLGNAIWNNNAGVSHEAQIALMRYYGMLLHSIDFETYPDKARYTINKKIEEITNPYVSQMIPDSAITKETGLLLTSSANIQNIEWITSFNKNETKEADFFLESGDAVKKYFMFTKAFVDYAKGENYEVVDMPLFRNISISLILPELGKLKDIVADFSAIYQEIENNLILYSVDVKLPKFSLDLASYDLKQPLNRLGITALFEHGTIISYPKVVESIFHKVYLNIGEHGINIESKDDLEINSRLLTIEDDPPKASITINRPFIVIIKEKETGQILFLGIVKT
ncbi:MAG: serpin family protein [Epsilonproteobacteria bacterium]|nr:serpin family protein [Campylobacterota bacterium]